MRFFLLFGLFQIIASACSFISDPEPEPLLHDPVTEQPGDDKIRVAIIGSGIAGAVTAFRIQELGSNDRRIEIDIYERSYTRGGQVKTLFDPKLPERKIEVGSPGFSLSDTCLQEVLRDVGLKIADSEPDSLPKRPAERVRWDGQKAIPASRCKMNIESEEEIDQKIWKYGQPFYTLRDSVTTYVNKWQGFASGKTFTDLQKELKRVLEWDNLLLPLETYFREGRVSESMQQDFLQDCVRERFFSPSSEVPTLWALAAASQQDQVKIQGGNIRLIDRLIKLSDATSFYHWPRVNSISYGTQGLYRVTHDMMSDCTTYEDYDIVVIAAPLQNANIDLGPLGIPQKPQSLQPDYRSIFVTNFISSHPLRPEYFGMTNMTRLPYHVLFTDSSNQTFNIQSIESQKFPRPPPTSGCALDNDECDQLDIEELLHKIVSTEYISEKNILEMIGQTDEGHSYLGDLEWRHSILSFYHSQFWKAAVPQVNDPGDMSSILGSVVLDSDSYGRLFYTGGADPVMPGMETSCRMAEDVARLVHRKIVELNARHPGSQRCLYDSLAFFL